MSSHDNPVPAVTPDFIEKMRRLERIFLPHSRSQRDDKLARDSSGGAPKNEATMRYAHYTTAEAAMKILSSKRLWMRNAKAMPDFSEVEHGYARLLKFFNTPNNRNRFVTAADACFPNTGQTILGRFDEWWNHIRYNTFIASVTDHRSTEESWGRLSMWRGFGNDNPRVALVLSIPMMSGAAMALGIQFSPVSYHSEAEAFARLDEAIQNTENERALLQGALTGAEFFAWWFQTLISAVTNVKHEGFYEEQEWRAVYTTALPKTTLLEQSAEAIGGVPQRVFKIPLDAAASPQLASLDMARVLHRVIIGPTAYPLVLCDAFVDALTKAGVPNPAERVGVSGIPLRT